METRLKINSRHVILLTAGVLLLLVGFIFIKWDRPTLSSDEVCSYVWQEWSPELKGTTQLNKFTLDFSKAIYQGKGKWSVRFFDEFSAPLFETQELEQPILKPEPELPAIRIRRQPVGRYPPYRAPPDYYWEWYTTVSLGEFWQADMVHLNFFEQTRTIVYLDKYYQRFEGHPSADQLNAYFETLLKVGK